MNEIYQEGTLEITDNNADINNAYNFFNILDDSKYIMNWFMHSIKDNISMLLWSEASSATQAYCAEEITEVDYQNKALWNGIFTENLEFIKQETINGSIVSATVIDLLKEQLYELQGLVGKYTLSPQDYEEGLESLKQYFADRKDLEVSKYIEEVRLQFIKELTEQPEVLGECLEGDIISAFEQEAGKLRIGMLKAILNYYKPLFKDAEIYHKYLSWVKDCYVQQDLLPLFYDELSSNASSEDLELAAKLPTIIAKDKLHDLSWLGLQHLSKMIWENKGTIITLCLASQGAMGQVLKNSTSNETFIPDNYSFANSSELMPFINSNNSDVNSSINNTIRSITDDPDFNKALLRQAIKLQQDLVIKSNNTNFNETKDEVLSRKKRDVVGDGWFARYTDCLEMDVLNAEFSKIKAELQETISRTKRAIVAHRPKVCSVTEVELRNVRTLIDHAYLSGEVVIQSSNDDCISNDEPNNCKQLVKLVRCNLQKLIDQYIKVKTSQFFKEEESDKLQTYYAAALKNYTEIEQRYSSTMQQVKLNIHNITTLLSKLFEQLPKCKESIEKGFNDKKSDVIEHCADKIKLGEVNKAITKFEAFRPLTQGSVDHTLSSIIAQTYADNTQAPNIIKFISGLSDYDHHLIAYDELIKEMGKADKLKDPVVLIIYWDMKRSAKLAELAELHDSDSNPWAELADKLESKANEIIQEFGNEIRKGNYTIINSYATNYLESSYEYLPHIIRNAYAGNIYNAEKVISFIPSLPDIKHDVIGYPVLFDEMKSSNGLNGHELLMLGYKVKARLGDINYAGITEAAKQQLRNVQDNLPEGVKQLLSYYDDKIIKITSKKLASNVLGISTGTACYRYTCATSSHIETCPSSESQFSYVWEVHIHEYGRYFSFKSGTYSFGATDKGGMTAESYKASNKELQWEVIPVDDGKYFYFKNRANQRILDSNNLEAGPFFGIGTGSCSNVHAHAKYQGSDYHKWAIS